MKDFECLELYKQALAFVNEAAKTKEGVIGSKVIAEKFPVWGNPVIAYLREKDFAGCPLPSAVNLDPEDIPAIKAYLEFKIRECKTDFWTKWITVGVSAVSLAISIVALCVQSNGL